MVFRRHKDEEWDGNERRRPAVVLVVNDERAQEALNTGATRVATACPFCYIMLDDGVKGAGVDDDQVKVADISMHVLEAIERGEREGSQVGAGAVDD